MSLRVLKPGLLTTVQDRGRHGLQYLGVVPCGAMDPVALELANALAGNQGGEAALEITVLGPELHFESDALIALCGAEFDARIAGGALPLNRPVLVTKQSRLIVGRAHRGSRAYLAVAGGIGTAPVLGSRSTCLPAKFGGFDGRTLRAGDVLPLVQNASDLAFDRFKVLSSRKELQKGVQSVAWAAPALTVPEREPGIESPDVGLPRRETHH